MKMKNMMKKGGKSWKNEKVEKHLEQGKRPRGFKKWWWWWCKGGEEMEGMRRHAGMASDRFELGKVHRLKRGTYPNHSLAFYPSMIHHPFAACRDDYHPPPPPPSHYTPFSLPHQPLATFLILLPPITAALSFYFNQALLNLRPLIAKHPRLLSML